MNRLEYISGKTHSRVFIGSLLKHRETGNRYEVIRFERAVSIFEDGTRYEGETVCIFPEGADADYRKRCTPYKPWRKDIEEYYEVVG